MKGFDVMKRKLNVKNCVLSLIYALSIGAGIWFFASWIDVNAHNNYFENDYGDFAKWNVFTMFSDVLEMEGE